MFFIDEVNDEKDYYPFICLIVGTLGRATRAVCSSQVKSYKQYAWYM
jgi:hypothetical protein